MIGNDRLDRAVIEVEASASPITGDPVGVPGRSPGRVRATWRAATALWHSHPRVISVAVLVAVSLFVVVPRAVAPVTWTPDGFFYQAQVYELEGQSQSAALNRVFGSQTARHAPYAVVHDFRWVRYSAPNYRRRWLVPAMAAAISPLAGSRSLLYVSLLGYLLLGPAVFALLRIRFSPGISFAVAAVCLLLPTTRTWAGYPLTDSWGITMTVVSLIAGYQAIRRGGWQILWWMLAMLALSFTRDTVLVPLLGVAAVAVLIRSGRTLGVLTAGFVAALPAYLLFGVPLIRETAYNLNSYRAVAHPTLHYVLSHYLPALWSVVDRDLHYPTQFGSFEVFWAAVGVLLVLAVLFMVTRIPRRDPFLLLQIGGLVGAAVTVAVAVNYTDMRIELVFLPGVAAALAYSLSEPNWQRLWAETRKRFLRSVVDRAGVAEAGG